MHLFEVSFCHVLCSATFHAELDMDGYDKTTLFIAVPPLALVANEGDLEAKLNECNTTYTGARCDNCTAQHMEGTPKYKMCSICTDTRYCSKECQCEHWTSGHKDTCGKPLESKIVFSKDCPNPTKRELEAHRQSEMREERMHAACFNDMDRARRNASRNGKCSWHKCDRTIEGPIPFSLAINMCLVMKGYPHITLTHYCSTGCRNRDNAGYIGATIPPPPPPHHE